MQTWITDKNYRISASNLDNKRLGVQIYEGIHVLSSLLNINDKLVNPKRSVVNHPVAKFWKGYELDLLNYISIHMDEWLKRGYTTQINIQNYRILVYFISLNLKYMFNCSNHKMNEDLIKLHKQILINKKPEYYKEKWRI